MSCAACSARVEKAVSKLEGVENCSVNLLTNSMSVEGSATDAQIIEAVEKAGYGAYRSNEKTKTDASANADTSENAEKTAIIKRLIASAVILLGLMYVSMGYVMFGFPMPKALSENPMAVALIQLWLSALILVINQKFFISGFKGVINRAPNMDTLVSLGSGASFAYSCYVMYLMSGSLIAGEMEAAKHCLHDLYFESAAMILVLITVGKFLEARAKGKTTDAIRALMELAPKTVTKLENGTEKKVPIEELQVGDLFVCRPGENIAVDGVIIEGKCAVDESALTGESIPSDKAEGDSVSAGTVNKTGFIKCRASRVGEDTTLAQIIKTVTDASATKAPIAKIADRVSGVFVPAVILIAAVTFVIWLIAGQTVGFAVARGISVLVISCPCALGLATPVAIMVGNGVGARHGVLFKTATSLEETGKVKTVIFDKTGTLTKGEPKVTDIYPAKWMLKRRLLSLAASLEAGSEHPLAKAVIKENSDAGGEIYPISEFEIISGRGLTAVIDGARIYGGNLEYIKNVADVDNDAEKKADKLASEGKTPLFFAFAGEFIGIIAVADVIKPDSTGAVEKLKDMGINVIMLTGDNERTAWAIAKQIGIENIAAGVLPKDKANIVNDLKIIGKTAMVGDGINDAPALANADIGIAIGAGTDIAIDSAEVVLMNSKVADVVTAIRLSRATLKNIKENLFWAFFYNTVGIPVAAGALFAGFGVLLSPMLGAAAMSLSSFCVVMNALRLNFAKVADKPVVDNEIIINEVKENKQMEKVMKIEGMMCPHCEARVKKCLEALPEVTEAKVSHKEGTAVVVLASDVSDDVLKKTVEDQGYTVL